MSDVFDHHEGDAPLLISIPHDGHELPPEIAARMTDAGRAMPDNDWHVRRLYGFARWLDASVIAARYSRYVIDLNRPESDEPMYPGRLSTGLLPTRSFAGEALYPPGRQPDDAERRQRIERYWRPYHRRLGETLMAIRERFGHALLWDAHSIRSEVPLLFDGTLPDLNVGTNGGASCAATTEAAVMRVAADSAYSAVLNGRFKGGYTTRFYGAPRDNVHAIQLELAQRCYMDETTLRYDEEKSARLGAVIRRMLETYLATAAQAGEAGVRQ